MDANPYASPQSESPQSDPETGNLNSKLKYRVFATPVFSFRLSRANYQDEIRQQAQQTIEHEIGMSNVVSILEHPSVLHGFEVVVWYRAAQ